MPRQLAFLALLCLFTWSLGCSGTTTVSGTVTYKGEALTEGEVSFVPDDGKPPRTALIDPDGSYKINNPPLGANKVLVIAKKMEEPPPAKGGKGNPVSTKGGPAVVPAVPAPKSLIPTKYSAPATTPFQFTIASGRNQLDLPLAD